MPHDDNGTIPAKGTIQSAIHGCRAKRLHRHYIGRRYPSTGTILRPPLLAVHIFVSSICTGTKTASRNYKGTTTYSPGMYRPEMPALYQPRALRSVYCHYLLLPYVPSGFTSTILATGTIERTIFGQAMVHRRNPQARNSPQYDCTTSSLRRVLR